jgi:hypothetical protein
MTTIGVCAQSLPPRSKATLDALGEALNVSFERRTFGDDQDIDGWLVIGADRKLACEISLATRPCYVTLDETELVSCGTSSTIAFANRAEVAAVLRGRNVTAEDAAGAKALPHWLLDVVPIAFKDGWAVWAIQERGHCVHQYVALSPPELKQGQALFNHFGGQRMACLLPLVLFVRALTEDHSWKPPPLQATFMFDDPNLHTTSYGFIDYLEMIRRAAADNYHVSLSTIPLDSWFVHESANAIFRQNTDRISLLCHGNDHLPNELGPSQSREAIEGLLRQAIVRIARMEARTGLEIARVMAPPYGACSETALSEMALVGFEAVCVSCGSLHHHNSEAAWTRTIGMKPCDMIAGLGIIPRFGLSKHWRNEVLIAALLHRPIVPVTHHQAVADGYGVLDEMASFVNSIGNVKWRDTKSISRSLYSQRCEQKTMEVRMLNKRVSVPVPPETTEIRVERPWLEGLAEEPLFWRAMSRDGQWNVTAGRETIAVQSGATIEIASGLAGATQYERRSAWPPRLTPIARRLLTESRDRALPSIHRAARWARHSRLA